MINQLAKRMESQGHKVFRRGDALLIRGDALELLPQMPREAFAAIVTDPPYSSGGMYRGDRAADPRQKYATSDAAHSLSFTGDNRDQRSYLAWTTLWLTAAAKAAERGAILSIFTDWRQLPTTSDAIQCAGLIWRGIATWCKPSARPVLGRYTQNGEFVCWATKGARKVEGATARGYCLASPPKNRVHLTEKPTELLAWLLEPIRPGGAVLDPFAGSGTAAVAALASGRQYVGFELCPTNFETAAAKVGKA